MRAERNAALTTLTYMVRAILAMPSGQRERLVGGEAQPWAEILERVTRSLRLDLAPVVVPLLSELSNRADRMTDTQRRLVGESARRILAFGWDEPRRVSGLILTALEAVCRTYESDADASDKLLRRSLGASHLASYGYQEMPHLVREIERLIPIAAKLIEDMYRAILAHEEKSNESVPLGHSAIMPLTSNRSQDYKLAVYRLGNIFPRFAESSPVHATGAVIAAVEAEIAPKALVPLEEIPGEPIRVGDAEARLAGDLSHIWDCDGRSRHDTPLRMLDEFESMLVRLAQDPARVNVLRAVLERVVRESRFAAVWRRILRAATKVPSTLGMEVRSLLFSREVLTCGETSEPAGNFIGSIFQLLSVEERERIEQVILAVPEGHEGDRKAREERVRDRLLGCLPPDQLVTEAAKDRIATLSTEGGVPTNDPPFRMGEATWEEYSHRKCLRDEGVDVDDEPNRLLIELGTAVEQFARRFQNEDPEKDAVRGVLHTLRSLYQELRRETAGANAKVSESATTQLIGACAAIARAEWLADDSEVSGFIRTVLLEASAGDGPEPGSEVAAQYEEHQVVHPSPRWHAANGLCRLAWHPFLADMEVLGAIVRLSKDPHPAVRAEIGRGLGLLLGTARETVLEILIRICREDVSLAVVRAALAGGSGLLASHPDVVAPLVTEVFDRASSGPTAGELRKTCLKLSLALNRTTVDPYGGPIVSRVRDDVIRNEELAVELVFMASGHLFDGPVEQPQPRAEQVRFRSIELLTTVVRQLASEFRTLYGTWKEKKSWSEEERVRAEIVHKLAHQVGLRIQFASEVLGGNLKGTDDRSQTSAQAVGARFLREGGPLLDTLLTVPFADVVHSVLETLQRLVDFDPGPVLQRIRAAVRSGLEGAYQLESLGLGLIVKLVRQYLAEHRRLLQEDTSCREAIVDILDVFVCAGWPAAMELTFRLEEVFR